MSRLAGERTFTAPFQIHSETSREAATAIIPKLGRLEAQVLGYFRAAGVFGLTDDELQQMSDTTSVLRPRRRSLEQQGLVKDSGDTRLTRSGKNAVVWVITPAGMAS